jgi:tRNA 2-thiocytidine biosynthesis protein TtcA
VRLLLSIPIQSPFKLLRTKIRKGIVQALSDYQMIEEGDRLLVAVSGGKDSSVLLCLLEEIRQKSKMTFSLEAVLLDQKQPGFEVSAYRSWVEALGIPFTLLEEDTYSIVTEKIPAGQTYCSLCSRLRRGILYNYASEHGFSKIALGHHREDINETALLNMFYNARLAAMPPKLRADDGRNIVIRPLAYIPEKWLEECAQTLEIPIIPCNLCGSQEGLKREKMKKLLQSLEAENENIGANLLASLQNIKPSQLLDPQLWDFNTFQKKLTTEHTEGHGKWI